MLDLGRASKAFYSSKREQFLEEYEEKARSGRGSFATPDKVAVGQAGPMFAGLVLESYRKEVITSSDVSDLLGVRLKHVPNIETSILKLSELA